MRNVRFTGSSTTPSNALDLAGISILASAGGEYTPKRSDLERFFAYRTKLFHNLYTNRDTSQESKKCADQA